MTENPNPFSAALLKEAAKPTAAARQRPEPKSAAPAKRAAAPVKPGRVGKRNITGYFPPEVSKQLKILAAQQETTVQSLLAEGLNEVFAKYRMPQIATTK